MATMVVRFWLLFFLFYIAVVLGILFLSYLGEKHVTKYVEVGRNLKSVKNYFLLLLWFDFIFLVALSLSISFSSMLSDSFGG